jgi:hypothetical protein
MLAVIFEQMKDRRATKARNGSRDMKEERNLCHIELDRHWILDHWSKSKPISQGCITALRDCSLNPCTP